MIACCPPSEQGGRRCSLLTAREARAGRACAARAGFGGVGTDRSPHGSSCSCAYSRLPLQPRSSSAALKSPYIIKGKIVCWVLVMVVWTEERWRSHTPPRLERRVTPVLLAPSGFGWGVYLMVGPSAMEFSVWR